MPTEAERAAEYRRQRAARCEARCQRLTQLAGDPAARVALAAAWQPTFLARLEAEMPPEPDEECVCP